MLWDPRKDDKNGAGIPQSKPAVFTKINVYSRDPTDLCLIFMPEVSFLRSLGNCVVDDYFENICNRKKLAGSITVVCDCYRLSQNTKKQWTG